VPLDVLDDLRAKRFQREREDQRPLGRDGNKSRSMELAVSAREPAGRSRGCAALSTKHLEDGELGMRFADHRVVRGMIEWDGAGDGRAPLLVIHGREVTWNEFGRMLMSFERWQFKLDIEDKSEEL
jgi:hypothetical protein